MSDWKQNAVMALQAAALEIGDIRKMFDGPRVSSEEEQAVHDSLYDIEADIEDLLARLNGDGEEGEDA